MDNTTHEHLSDEKDQKSSSAKEYNLDLNYNLQYNEVCWLCTHNAFSSSAYGWIYFQQILSIEEQLQYGVRAFMIDVWPCKGDIYLLHGGWSQTLLQRPFKTPQKLDWFLPKIKTWLNDHPKDIITLIMESYLEDGKLLLKDKLTKAGLYDMVYKLKKGKWDTLDQMIKDNKRLVITSRKSSDGVITAKNNIIENHWDYDKNKKGDLFYSSKGSIFVFNHFKPVSLLPVSYILFNKRKDIEKRIEAASMKLEKLYDQEVKPNFVAVDFVQYGDAREVVRRING
jgi:hypothetical protein